MLTFQNNKQLQQRIELPTTKHNHISINTTLCIRDRRKLQGVTPLSQGVNDDQLSFDEIYGCTIDKWSEIHSTTPDGPRSLI